jgi:hypothetical protein
MNILQIKAKKWARRINRVFRSRRKFAVLLSSFALLLAAQARPGFSAPRFDYFAATQLFTGPNTITYLLLTALVLSIIRNGMQYVKTVKMKG